MTTLRWGILGPGRIATRMVGAVAGCARGELVAVGSRDAGRAARFAADHGIARSFGSYEALVASPDVDVIYIALPNHLHVPWTIRALEAGKHVLCEKPLALAAHDVDAIAAACERTGQIAVEGFMYLHHPQILRTLELVRSGALGPLELVNGTFSFFLTDEGDVRVDPTDGRRFRVGRRLLPGEHGPPDRRRGTGPGRCLRPLRRAGRRPDVPRPAPLPERAVRPVRQRLRGTSPGADRGRRTATRRSSSSTRSCRSRTARRRR